MRVNFEEKDLSDPRFLLLIERVGCHYKAAGLLSYFRMAAIRYWGKNRSLLPESMFPPAWQPLIDCGWAERREGGIFYVEAEEHFGWYLSKVENGKKGASKRWTERSTVANDSEAMANASEVEANDSDVCPPTPIPSPAPTKEREETPGIQLSLTPPDLKALWNENCGSLPTVREITEERRRKWRARWNGNPDHAYWISVVERIAATPFCQGTNGRGWRADVDFFLRPNTHVRVMEGSFDAGDSSADEAVSPL